MILRIYDFIVKIIATPLATLLIALGAVLIMLSGFNANWYTKGKEMIKWAIIAILLIYGSWLIVDLLLKIIGYGGQWHVFP